MRYLKLFTTILVIFLIFPGVVVGAAANDSGRSVQLPEWPVTAADYGGTLLLSDSPELVHEDGIMYQDTVNGKARLFFHHVNATKEQKKIVVVLENSGSKDANITVYRHGLGGPSLNYLQVGKDVQFQYFSEPDMYSIDIPPARSRLLIDQLNDAVVEPDMLVNGMYDFTADQPVTVKVVMMPVKENAYTFAAKANILPADQWRLRGTFAHSNRVMIPHKIYNPLQHGTVAVTLADNIIDPYMQGIDATDGTQVLNYGNYGVVYRLFMPSSSMGKAAYSFNPRGGVYAGALGLKYQHTYQLPVGIPQGHLCFGENTLADRQSIGTFDGGQSLWFSFLPPGASNLPVKIILESP